ncbi:MULTISPECIES: spore germination protein [unclassified Dehalobacter]|uniref:spore germination protein n=1 Tax=unclassified Dehalobacter TaxID=2635733 RepID=UPI000E6B8CAE|nr:MULTISPECIES: spore germination protein [unclassified Dehalobacter]RJE48593.1 spore gernimation protein GerA [Dehalobacter sp. MCB1]TCX46732.1 spore germination protein [Dehalobacter sp. 14DCB1]TCX51237.1 spore germination protein [Dehalobacter sp. 12DCB1]
MFIDRLMKTLKNRANKVPDPLPASGAPKKEPLSKNYEDNLKKLQQSFANCSDVQFHPFQINLEEPVRAFIVYATTITDNRVISDSILKTLLEETRKLQQLTKGGNANLLQIIQDSLLNLTETSTVSYLDEVEQKMFAGNAVLIIDGSSSALAAGVRGGENRSIVESDTEPGVRGPKDGFIESIDTNMSLIRRRLKTSRLKLETLEVGELTHTKIAICYIEGIVNEQLLQEVKQRLGRIKTDSILEGSYIEELIMDEQHSLFPLVQYTERPDKVTASLLEGRIAVLVDNSPMPLLIPATFVTMLQAAEDYYHGSVFATFTRILRLIALNLALLLPSVTVAVFSFHQELLPTHLVSSVAGTRQGLPLPIALEILVIEFTFELLREAGVRLPKTIGQAISTVGGLVIGQAAVNAGLVSPISVIVVATTAIASFSIPNYDAGYALRILRFMLILLASFLGGVGIMFGLMIILIHLCSLRSFGVPYLIPFAPLSLGEIKDILVRAPWWAMSQRPKSFRTVNPVRQKDNQGPSKPMDRRKRS